MLLFNPRKNKEMGVPEVGVSEEGVCCTRKFQDVKFKDLKFKHEIMRIDIKHSIDAYTLCDEQKFFLGHSRVFFLDFLFQDLGILSRISLRIGT